MLSRELRSLTTPMIRIMRLIWGAFCAAAVFYCVLAYVMTQNRPETTTVTQPDLLLPISAVAVLCLAASFFVPRFLLSDARVRGVLTSGVLPPGGDGFVKPAPAIPGADKLRTLPEEERRLPHLLVLYQSSMIVSLALVEAVSIFGLILVIMGHSWPTILPFALATILFAIPHLPRPEAMLEAGAKMAHHTRQGRP